MLSNRQQLGQRQQQSLQQKLSPQQLQYIKLLQLPTIALEQRIKEEMELNPVLEQMDAMDMAEERLEPSSSLEEPERTDSEKDEDDIGLETLEEHEVDWDEFDMNTEFDGENYSASYAQELQEIIDLPDAYHTNLLEQLEQQVALLNLEEDEDLIAAQILGSLDKDGYFRRDFEAVADNIAFNHGVYFEADDVDRIRKQIQLLDPIGIASVDLQDCLLVQLEQSPDDLAGRTVAIQMIRDHWRFFEKKNFGKLLQRLNVEEEELKEAFEAVRHMDPRPGAQSEGLEETSNYIEPDFEVYWQAEDTGDNSRGEFVINLNQRNAPSLRISPEYSEMWEQIKAKKTKSDSQTQSFIKNKIDSGNWFIDSIRQRQNTLMNTMKTMVALQEDFFKYGDGIRPMILKDVAERIGMDISTVSRVVNGKYVQTHFGVYELKYFFNEGLETESGEEVSNREVKNALQEIIDQEDKSKPLSDQALAKALSDRGYKVARRTVSKYREQLNEPVARLRKELG
ncbi:MAG: RNA polymerase factor sigma-54 [Bacteroidota bacterium]